MTEKILQDRVAVITGASRGIGAAVAKRFAVAGAKCVLIARTVGALEELDDEIRQLGGAPALLVPQDLMKLDALDQLGPSLAKQLGRVDIFVGNAGMLGTLGPVAQSNPEMWENVMRLNVMANQRLIATLDPLLRGSDAGRAIFVSSAAAHKHRAHWGAYAASKAALEQMVLSYAEEVRHTPLTVNVIDPGRVQTEMRALAYPGEDSETLPHPDDIAPSFVKLAAPDFDRSGEIIKAAA
jgi:NAD(P)-dependent dehydrogenase (short-subunit alcohol dehydrogenase family)